jgi:hypothetical protein
MHVQQGSFQKPRGNISSLILLVQYYLCESFMDLIIYLCVLCPALPNGSCAAESDTICVLMDANNGYLR